jgi:hypothetical protein
MAYEIRKISNYGTQNPVVARLKVQTHELAQWSNLSEDKKLELSAVYFGLADRLLKCHEIYRRISAKIEREISEHRPNADSRMKKVPYVVGLRGEVENFLYESKSYLRDLLSVLDIFFGAKFDEASAFYPTKAGGKSKLVIWAATKFGPSDHLNRNGPLNSSASGMQLNIPAEGRAHFTSKISNRCQTVDSPRHIGIGITTNLQGSFKTSKPTSKIC